jgi:hypothetical protein
MSKMAGSTNINRAITAPNEIVISIIGYVNAPINLFFNVLR